MHATCRLLLSAHLHTQQQAVGMHSWSRTSSHGGTMQSLLTQSCCQHIFSPNMSRHETPPTRRLQHASQTHAPSATKQSILVTQLLTQQQFCHTARQTYLYTHAHKGQHPAQHPNPQQATRTVLLPLVNHSHSHTKLLVLALPLMSYICGNAKAQCFAMGAARG